MRSISTELDFGNGLTLEAYTSTINRLRSKLAAYNTALSSIDQLADDVSNEEQIVMAMSENMLLGVGSRYGKTSQQYEMAGGSRRKKSRRTSSTRTAISSTTNPAPTASLNGSANGTSPATVI